MKNQAKKEFEPTKRQLQFLKENLGILTKPQLCRKFYCTRNQLDLFIFRHKIEPKQRNLQPKNVEYVRIPVYCESKKLTWILVEKGKDIEEAKRKYYERESRRSKVKIWDR